MIQVNKGIRDFLIKFRGSNDMYIFNSANDLLELLKTSNKYGIEYIKEFDNVKLRFKQVSKETIRLCFDHNTELDLEHFNKGYFK